MKRTIAILGAGGFGQAMAQAATNKGHQITVWTRKKSLPNPAWNLTSELSDCATADLIMMAVPSPYADPIARELGGVLDGHHLFVHVSRGLVGEELQTISQVIRRHTVCRRVGVLAGPLVPESFASETPTGAVVGTHFSEVEDAVRDAFENKRLRIFANDDLVGVEFSSAIVGLFALVFGYGCERGFKAESQAVYLSRAMREANEVALALGAKPLTLSGLSGYGDLLAVVAGDARPEAKLGAALAQGRSLRDAGQSAGAHIEGLRIAKHVAAFVGRHHIDAPILRGIAAAIDQQVDPRDLIDKLMAEASGAE